MIGLGTYSYFWRHSDRVPAPMSLADALDDTRAQGVELFQICDYAPLERMSETELRETARRAEDLGIRLQLGTKGIEPERLTRFLRIAQLLGADLVRSMLFSPETRPDREQSLRWLAAAVPTYRAAGVTLALETYEQVATADLVEIVNAVGDETLGICLDPGNVVARLESPRACVEQTAPLVRNVHAKDFAFARQPGWVGFTYSGARMGDGLHDYPHLLATVDPRGRGIDEIVEHWLPWQGDPETTTRIEREWTRATIDYLRSTQ